LGEIIDYEVPLKETEDAKHGDIDLLCLAPGTILCVEAKDPRKPESILKAVLQAFVYTSLIAIRHDAFVAEFGLPTTFLLTPAILIGKAASSQLQQWGERPHLGELVRMLNIRLANSGAGRIRFFSIENDEKELRSCLTTVAQPSGNPKIIFANGFTPKVFAERLESDFVDADLHKAFKLLCDAETQKPPPVRATAHAAIEKAEKALLDSEERLRALQPSDQEPLQLQRKLLQGVIKRFRSQSQ
jgi:hypothetical protein